MIICSSQDEEKSHIISKLHMYRRQYVPFQVTGYQQYLHQHFVSEGVHDYQTVASSPQVMASEVDRERYAHGLLMGLGVIVYTALLCIGVCHSIRSCVRVVSSTRAGMGKSLFITRMAERLLKRKGEGTVIITIPIHGPHVTTDTVMEYLGSHQDNTYGTILHFDIAPSVNNTKSTKW